MSRQKKTCFFESYSTKERPPVRLPRLLHSEHPDQYSTAFNFRNSFSMPLSASHVYRSINKFENRHQGSVAKQDWKITSMDQRSMYGEFDPGKKKLPLPSVVNCSTNLSRKRENLTPVNTSSFLIALNTPHSPCYCCLRGLAKINLLRLENRYLLYFFCSVLYSTVLCKS